MLPEKQNLNCGNSVKFVAAAYLKPLAFGIHMRSIEGKITKKLADVVNDKDITGGDGYPVKSFRELVEHAAALSYLNKDHLLFYRGQGIDYKNKNDKSSFYPSIYRGEYLPKKEMEHKFDILHQASKILVELLDKRRKEGAYELKRKKYIQWSVLQHYEVCDTPLIDFTHSLRVACSFAFLKNRNTHAYIYVFGLPYFTNRISINSEHDLVNIRLLSICPPDALRPYFQEGYLAATSDVDHEYESKSELDFNRRLIVKFRITNNDKFWGDDFTMIPESALYHQNDLFNDICKEIKVDVQKELKPGEIGEFLYQWNNLEEKIVKLSKFSNHYNSILSSIKELENLRLIDENTLNNLQKIRHFRNDLVHSTKNIKLVDVERYKNLLSFVSNEIDKKANK